MLQLHIEQGQYAKAWVITRVAILLQASPVVRARKGHRVKEDRPDYLASEDCQGKQVNQAGMEQQDSKVNVASQVPRDRVDQRDRVVRLAMRDHVVIEVRKDHEVYLVCLGVRDRLDQGAGQEVMASLAHPANAASLDCRAQQDL